MFKEFILKNRKRFIFFTSLSCSLLIVSMGGVKLMIYFLLLLTGLFLGIHYERLKRLYADYKLSLRVNSIITSSKQYEEQEKEIERLRRDLSSMSERLNFYQSAHNQNLRMQGVQGGIYHGNFSRDGTPRVWEDE